MFLRHRFPPGRYVIVPCTFNPNEEGEFLLRLYTDKKGYAMELTEHHPEKAWYQMCGPEYQCALRIKIVSAVGLEKQVRREYNLSCKFVLIQTCHLVILSPVPTQVFPHAILSPC